MYILLYIHIMNTSTFDAIAKNVALLNVMLKTYFFSLLLAVINDVKLTWLQNFKNVSAKDQLV